ncbi:RNA polymerase factor sigma-54 [Chondromyces apiculatus]|uniref:RNA polymerase sigma-54 factor RpoN n=1 Tax=Chondromyces apiculatus DSM 436 TaxID=1192034 RepID=A0A017T9H3_9BACT|nr:RNA polymerase factor sigma-54 [Chondromyces apiculatus]EYF05547.1 RNA polymerase sigma-54 factor RpoN [Chondromyces apiculatus DSM 436]
MGMEMKLQFKLSQQLVMTPQLVQAIRLLQLSRLELVDEIRKELDGNPVLADDGTDPKPKEKAVVTDTPTTVADFSADGRLDAEGERFERSDTALRDAERRAKETDWEQFLENRQLQQALPTSRGGFEEMPPIEQNLTKASSLQDHLMWQLQLSDFVDNERMFALFVIGNLDERGYLDLKGGEGADGTKGPDMTVADLAQEAGLNPEDAEEVLAMIQRFDPIGVAARDLSECLRVQAEVLGYDVIELSIIKDHLHNVERRNFGAIAKALKISLEEVYESVQEIQKLESVPARNFAEVDEKTISITPDVYVIKDGDQFVVTDNDKGLQRLYINENLAQKMLKDPKAKEFISEKLRSAQWLIRAIEQRRRTIIKVTECIVEKQREFLERGVAYLKPMILRDVAESVGMHESTISRVTSNKYVHTPQGLFELKYFFNSSIHRVSDEDIASESVKQAIKKIIAAEDKGNPHSDQAIVKILEDQDGIRIARRTVAKYREMLGILSSSKRKKMF